MLSFVARLSRPVYCQFQIACHCSKTHSPACISFYINLYSCFLPLCMAFRLDQPPCAWSSALAVSSVFHAGYSQKFLIKDIWGFWACGQRGSFINEWRQKSSLKVGCFEIVLHLLSKSPNSSLEPEANWFTSLEHDGFEFFLALQVVGSSKLLNLVYEEQRPGFGPFDAVNLPTRVCFVNIGWL